MIETRELHGFPLEIAGTKQFRGSETWRDDSVHLAALGQLLERTILDGLGKYTGDLEKLTEIVHESLRSSLLAPHLGTVRAARLTDTVLEVEFSAVGYPDRYIKYMHVDGPRGAYKLTKVAVTSDAITVRHQWHRTPEGTFCIGEAVDKDHKTLSRVTITLEYDKGSGLSAYDAEHAIRDVELSACRIAREIAE